MADLMEKRAAWLDAQQRRFMSGPVTYCRGERSVELLAQGGRSEFVVADENGVATAWQSQDFLITAADLVLGGQATRPAPGDRIRRTRGTAVEVFEVLAPAGQQCFRTDDQGITLRVFAKQVGVEPA